MGKPQWIILYRFYGVANMRVTFAKICAAKCYVLSTEEVLEKSELGERDVYFVKSLV